MQGWRISMEVSWNAPQASKQRRACCNRATASASSSPYMRACVYLNSLDRHVFAGAPSAFNLLLLH